MSEVSIRKLIEAGVHFGHPTRMWNPKMRRYIYGERNGRYLFDLEQTSRGLDNACDFLRKMAKQNKNIVFVGTKRHAAEVIESEAKRCNSYYVNRRWLGGMLTNFETIRLRINRLRELRQSMETGDFYRKNKKEQSFVGREYLKLQNSLGGLADLRGKPEVLIVVDQRRENTAILEAKKLGITTIVLVDTDCNPDGIDYVIPANDDSIRAIRLVLGTLADAIIEGSGGKGTDQKVEMEAPVPTGAIEESNGKNHKEPEKTPDESTEPAESVGSSESDEQAE